MGCSIISALIQEYATTIKSSDIGLTWEVHFKAKKQFEVSHLKRIFKFCVQAVGELTKEIPESILPLIKHLLSICESVLTWGFIYMNYILFNCHLCIDGLIIIHFSFKMNDLNGDVNYSVHVNS